MNCICRSGIIGDQWCVGGRLTWAAEPGLLHRAFECLPKVHFFFFFLRPYSILLGKLFHSCPHTDQKGTSVTVMVFMSYTWHISLLYQSCWEKVNLIFSSCTRIHFCILSFSISALSRMCSSQACLCQFPVFSWFSSDCSLVGPFLIPWFWISLKQEYLTFSVDIYSCLIEKRGR